ncbi:restriction endonuclease [Noviherbaspirillum sp. 1P10PC]|uniref:restriction endonuclease n=1 Tax=Noviherbaspirillum sp. 1P10PC TaxID=3132292 RepID=UPI0039A2F558
MSFRGDKHVEGEFVSLDSTSQPPSSHQVHFASSVGTLGHPPPFPIGYRDCYPQFKAHALKAPPITSVELRRLISDLNGKPVFHGVATIAPDGVPFFLMTAPDAHIFKTFKKHQALVTIWCWETPFGNVLSVSSGVDMALSPARSFMPVDAAAYQAACVTRKITFALYHGGNVSQVFHAKLDTEPQRFKGLVALATLPASPTFLYKDFELAYWWLMALPESNWSAQVAKRPKELLQASWGRWTASTVMHFSRLLATHRKRKSAGDLSVPFDSVEIRDAHPLFNHLLDAIDGNDALDTVLAIAGESVVSVDAAEDMMSAISKAGLSDYHDHDTLFVAHQALRTSWHVHATVRSGLRRPWFDTRGTLITPRYIDLDPVALGVAEQDYWRYADLDDPFNHGMFMTGRDIPADLREIMQSIGTMQFHGTTLGEVQTLVQSLLAEAAEHRQWTVPWGARVQIGLGMFQYADLYEIGAEFYCMLRDASERYFLARVDLTRGTVMVPHIYSYIDNTVELHENAMAILGVILAGIIRDFLVVENRQNVFGQRTQKVRANAGRAAYAGLAVVYLPRVRYDKAIDIQPVVHAFSEFKPKVAHQVNGHLRRSNSASAEQILLAHKNGINVPAGFTWVRPHTRGLHAEQEIRREYRSRSATRLLFAAVESDINRKAEWFDFERDIRSLMKSLGLTVEQVNGTGSGESSINVIAFNSVTNDIWAIRCLCLGTWQKVDAETIHDVAGSLSRYPTGTKGMVVTTSGFTQGAMDAAAGCDFMLLDGPRLTELLRTR